MYYKRAPTFHLNLVCCKISYVQNSYLKGFSRLSFDELAVFFYEIPKWPNELQSYTFKAFI